MAHCGCGDQTVRRVSIANRLARRTRRGLRHGFYCLGCCWALMCLLFVIGTMNLAWVGALTLAVLAEKALAGGEWIGKLLGVALIAAGVLKIATIS